jgi:transcriptional regulator with PAS, ATPase and Fis domain
VLEDQVIRRVGGIRDMQVDVRVIAASNRDLEKAVREGQFRQDLYYRLAIIAIFIPPLRERKEDILPLVDFFIERYNRRFKKSVRGITDETRRLIFTHNWPGNVRELKNTIERGMILEDEPFLRPEYLPFSVGESGGRTLFERTFPPTADSPCRTAACCRGSIFRKAVHLWKRWSTPWSSWPCARPTATRPTPPSCSTSAATLSATS